MTTPHGCRDCGEETRNERGDPTDGRCRDCDLDYVFATGSCRECLVWIMIEEACGRSPAAQHVPGCSLSESTEYQPRTEAEIADVRERRR